MGVSLKKSRIRAVQNLERTRGHEAATQKAEAKAVTRLHREAIRIDQKPHVTLSEPA